MPVHGQATLSFFRFLTTYDFKDCRNVSEVLLGIYETALPALRDVLQRHLADTNPLADHPSVRVIRFALLEIGEMLVLGQASEC